MPNELINPEMEEIVEDDYYDDEEFDEGVEENSSNCNSDDEDENFFSLYKDYEKYVDLPSFSKIGHKVRLQ